MQLGFSTVHDELNTHDFDCGDVELNFYLKELSIIYQKRHFGATVVFFEKNDIQKKVIGYYTICPASIHRELLPSKMLTGPRPNPIPAFRLCRLAVDLKFQGQGLGKIIFVHSLKKCIDYANQIGGNIVIIDAKNEKAQKFYEHFGFKSIPENPLVLTQTIKYLLRVLEPSLVEV